MTSRARLTLAALPLALVACGGGPAALRYGLPAPAQVRYAYGDTTIVMASMMGQSMEVAMRGSAEYAVAFRESSSGVDVTLSVENLSGSITQPMGAPIRLGADAVEGELVFSLDRQGNASLRSSPNVALEASQFVSALGTAHTFFPGLPDRVVSAGDSWVDTVTYEGDDVTGPRSERSILRYTVAGDTTVAGRPLTKITFEGTSELSTSMDMQGMSIGQSSTLTLSGHVLWDGRGGVMFELLRRGEGDGSVNVPVAPQPLPIEVRMTQRARLSGT